MAYNKAFEKAVERKLLSKPYHDLGAQTSKTREKMFTKLFDQRKWPNLGWDDQTIETLVNEMSSMDSNNYPRKAGVGEREGRIYSPMVSRRHFMLAHGIGRSGDLVEAQPKAAGSSLMSSITNAMVKDMMKMFVSRNVVDAFILPMATGMSLTLVMLTMRNLKPEATYVVWSRIDQKSCFKSITTAGLIPIVVEPIRQGDELVTDLDGISQKIKEYTPAKIVCVMCTTSCFAPRSCDNIAKVSKICADANIYHLVNNAYGVQSRKCVNAIDHANRAGRLDVFVQSTDKNLMVPVGGTIVAGFNFPLLDSIKKSYPGRASCSQTLDVFVTMLSMGVEGYNILLQRRTENFEYLHTQLNCLAARFGERILVNPGNNISMGISITTYIIPAMTLRGFNQLQPREPNNTTVVGSATEVGSMLFRRNVNGARVVCPNVTNDVAGHAFKGWGSHCNEYRTAYLTCAATIGMQKEEVKMFIEKLEFSLKKLQPRANPVPSIRTLNDSYCETSNEESRKQSRSKTTVGVALMNLKRKMNNATGDQDEIATTSGMAKGTIRADTLLEAMSQTEL